MKFHRLKAGALQLTLFIAVVIALLLMAFIGIVHTHQRFNLQTDFVVETVDNANKGFEYAFQHNLQSNDTINIDLEDEDYKTLKVYTDYWGIFERTTVISNIKNYKFKKMALVGAKQPINNRLALFVEDNNNPLVVVGATRIQGLAYLPQQGVKSGNIAGHSYYGEQLIYGSIKTSSSLPKIKSTTLEHIKTIANLYKEVNQNQFFDIGSQRVFSNSFSTPTQIIYSHSDIDLSSITLTGNIVVQSQTKIVVASNAKLKDIILIAPEIEIKDNVIGSFQAFATTNIVVGTNCRLNYPTAFVLNEREVVSPETTLTQYAPPTQETTPTQMFIGEQSTIKGVLIFIGEAESNNYKPQIVVAEHASVIGEIYCNKNFELKGTVSGTVFTSNFVANESGSIYQNHIYNGQIVIDDLAQAYVGLEFEDSKKEVMKWLY